MHRTTFLLIDNINYKYCGRIVQGSYPPIVGGAFQFMRVLPQSSARESDMIRSPEKRNILLPRKSESMGKPLFEWAMIFLRKCGIYFSMASPLSSRKSQLSKFTS